MNSFLGMVKSVLVLLLMVLPIASCSGGGSSDGTSGTLEVSLTDAPGDYLKVFVTIKEVQVSQAIEDAGDDSGWLTVLSPGETFDLLELQNGVIASLGLVDLDAGQYNQMRLILDGEKPEGHPYANYLVIEGEEGEDPQEVELKVPSGLQTGIKLVDEFTIVASGSTELILDFDAHKSVIQAGASGQWLLKPTIKVLGTETYFVGGVIDTAIEGELSPVEGATVSAQVQNSDPVVVSATTSNAYGGYFMYLPITDDRYHIVVTGTRYEPQCEVLDFTELIEPSLADPVDFTLVAVEFEGTFAGSVAGLATGEHAVFSIRQDLGDCGFVEIASFNILTDSGLSAPVTLPVGTYQIVVSADGEDSQVFEEVVEVEDGLESKLEVVFPSAP